MMSIYDMSEKNGLILHSEGCTVLLDECEKIYSKLKKRIAKQRSLKKSSLIEVLMKYVMLTDMDILRIINVESISKYSKKGKRHPKSLWKIKIQRQWMFCFGLSNNCVLKLSRIDSMHSLLKNRQKKSDVLRKTKKHGKHEKKKLKKY